MVKRIGFAIVVIALALVTGIGTIQAQQVVLQPPKDGGSFKLMYKPDRNLVFNFGPSLDGAGAFLKIGEVSNSYNTMSISVSGTSLTTSANSQNLKPGRYYARITNSSFTRFSEIKSDNTPGVIYSNEIQFIIESQNAPRAVNPRGKITTSTPTFEWDPVIGPKSYWIIMSSTPFDIETDENDEISIQGANLVWQYITSGTSAQYGEINTNTPYQNEAPPLDPGQEYSYTILNLYEEDNPVFTSSVFGGIIPFTYENPNAIPKPVLIEPAEGQAFDGEPTVTFRWTEVEEAQNYTLNLYEVITQQGVDASVPIWSVNTSNNLVDYEALGQLKNSTYRWNVVANDKFGGGSTSGTSTSPTSEFSYNIDLGKVTVFSRSSLDNSELIGLEVDIRAISGGATPSIPLFVQSGSVSDSLVAGTYIFTATKKGFRVNEQTVEIRADQTTSVTFSMESLPASVSGRVVDDRATAVADANLSLTDIQNGAVFKGKTNSTGDFTLGAPAGTYQFNIAKSGYKQKDAGLLTLATNEAKEIDEDIVVPKNRETVSGYIQNENGTGVGLALVRASKANGESQEVRTNAEGFYRIDVSPGNWTVRTEKKGFVMNRAIRVEVSTGESLTNQNINLISAANQVSGFIREVILNEDGSTGSAPLNEALIRAIPNSGTVILARSSNNGSFNLDLKSGAYSITAEKNGFAISRPVQLTVTNGETLTGLNFGIRKKSSFISGQVVLPDGTGLSGATIRLKDRPFIQTTTKNGGYFTLSLAAGTYTLEASLPGYIAPAGKSVSLTDNQVAGGINFTMTPNAAVLSGNILSTGGDPLPYATVTAENTKGTKRTFSSNEFGEYKISLNAGSWTLTGAKYGYSAGSGKSAVVQAGQQVKGLDLRLTKVSRIISGSIKSGTSSIRDATVNLYSGGTKLRETLSKVDGSFNFTVETGKSYTVEVVKDRFNSVTAEVANLQPGTGSYPLPITLQRSPAQIQGKITTAAGLPLEDVSVEVRSGVEVLQTAATSFDGTYQVGVNAGSYTLNFIKPGYQSTALEITLNFGEIRTGISRSLQEAFALMTGTVEDNLGNQVADSRIELTGNETGYSARSDDNGSYSISKIIEGPYELSVSKNGYESITGNIEIESGQTLSRDFIQTILNGAVEGTVSDLSGNPVTGASVTLNDDEGNGTSAVSDADGGFAITGLPYGSYTLISGKAGYTESEEQSLTLSSGAQTVFSDLTVRKKDGVITGQITNSQTSTAIGNVTVTATGIGSDFSLTDNSGSYRIEGLSAGTYEVSAEADGFRIETETVTLNEGNKEISLDFGLLSNTGTIRGMVTNQNGTSLNQIIPVRAVSADESYETNTQLNGSFTFQQIPNGRTYTVTPEATGQGLVSNSTEITFGPDQTELELESPVTVNQNTGIISGDAGLYNALITLTNSEREVVRTRTSDLDGSFRFRFLEEGSYTVSAAADGYIFSPESADVENLGFGEQRSVSFNALVNSATLTVSVSDDDGAAVEDAEINLSSTDRQLSYSGSSDESGRLVIDGIDVSKTYILFVQKAGFVLETDLSSEITLQSGSSVDQQVTLSRNNSFLFGRVVSTVSGNPAIAGVQITLASADGLTQRTATTGSSGAFYINRIPDKTYNLTVERQSYSSTSQTFSISDLPVQTLEYEGESNSYSVLPDTELNPAFVRIRGVVLYNNTGIAGVTMVVTGSSELQTTTAADGSYNFEEFPVSFEQQDTVALTISSRFNEFAESQSVILTGQDLGTTITLPDIIIPSGSISGRVVSGESAVSGITAFLEKSGQVPAEYITDASGRFRSEKSLRAGAYSITLDAEGYLLPANEIIVTLEDDADADSVDISLPFTFSPPDTLQAVFSTDLTVNAFGVAEASVQSAFILYRPNNSSEFDTLALQYNEGVLTGTLPALINTQPVELYAEVNMATGSIPVYRTAITERIVGARGLLSKVTLQPRLDELVLRTNDSYTVTVTVKDGANNIMTEAFSTGGGTVTIDQTGEGVSASLDSDQLTLETGATAAASFVSLKATYQSQEIVTRIPVIVEEGSVNEITLQTSASGEIRNNEPFTFALAARDGNGERIFLGNALNWEVRPVYLGSITNKGVFTPAESSIGQFRVYVSDDRSGIKDTSDVVSMVARVQPEEEVRLQSGDIFELLIPESTLDGSADIKLKQQEPETVKKFATPSNSDGAFTGSDRIYDISVIGAELNGNATLTLSSGSALSLMDGERYIAHFDKTSLQWELLETTSLSDTLFRTSGVTGFSQFTVMAENESLGLEHFAVLPNPFSPDVAPAKIGYLLHSQNPPAYVTIRIHNMRGQLIRTLLDRDPQLPGRYGSSSGIKVVEWDGLNDAGDMSRNGRYILHIILEDGEAKEEYLETIVLIK